MVLEKDGEDQLERSCEKRSIKKGQGKEDVLHKVNRRKGSWIGHILHSNRLLKHVFEGKMREGYSDGKTKKKT